MLFANLVFCFLSASTEKATGQHEQPFEAGHEIREGHFGIQAFHESAPKRKGEVDSGSLQLPAPEKVRG